MSTVTLIRNSDLFTQEAKVINTITRFMKDFGHEGICNAYSVMCADKCLGLVILVNGKGRVISPYNKLVTNKKIVLHVEQLHQKWINSVSTKYKAGFSK